MKQIEQLKLVRKTKLDIFRNYKINLSEFDVIYDNSLDENFILINQKIFRVYV